MRGAGTADDGVRAESTALRRFAASDQYSVLSGHGAVSMTAAIESAADYFREASCWDSDRLAAIERSRGVAWRVAAAAWACAVGSSCALALLVPLKRVEPFVVRVDNSTGIVDVVPAYAGSANMDEAVSRYFLSHYVSVCERFDPFSAESDYAECGAFQTAQRNQVWAALWQTGNPNSPLVQHKDGSRVHVEVQSVSFFKRAGGITDLAQVRYIKSLRQSSDAPARETHWIATIQYAYGAPSGNVRLRTWNPLGFRVAEFNSEPEVMESVPATSGHPELRP
jgi:type IV secretion system protein VirB8